MKILIIDDDQETCTVLENYLKLQGFQPTSVYDGQSGLIEIRKNHYDRVILDMSMPKASGIDVLNELQNDNSDIPAKIVVYSAVPFSKEDSNLIMRKGASAILSKKEGLSELKKIIA